MFTIAFFSKFTNMIMKDGNKVLAQEILTQVRSTERNGEMPLYKIIWIVFLFLFQTLENIKRKQVEKYHKASKEKKEEIECNPYTIFHQALDNCKPVVGLASIQKGGKFYQASAKPEKPSLLIM